MLIPLLLTIIGSFQLLHGAETNNYALQCDTIRTALEHEKNDFFEMIYNGNLDPAQELIRINQQFAYYNNKLEKERCASLLQLKHFHNIEDEVWIEGIKNLEVVRTAVKKHINTTLSNAMHDPIISGENKIIFAHHLKKYGLDIKKIRIKTTDGPFDAINNFAEILKDEQKKTSTLHITWPKITVSTQCTSMEQKALLIKFAWIMGNMCTISTSLVSFLVENTKKDYTFATVQHTKDYLSFLTLEQGHSSEIFPCLEDYQACLCMENLRSSRTDLLNFDQHKEHFQQICTIKNLWEKRMLLEKLIEK